MLLSAEHISINFGARSLLTDVAFYLEPGEKVGVIGINGTGKSTFLRVLSGQIEPDQGTVTRDPNVQVSFLSQNPEMSEDATVLEQVFLSFPPEFRELNEYEAKSMLTKLGLTEFERKVGTLSGGQRKRLALAAALLHPADVLILDEPTNHLDTAMVTWLEDWLRRFRGGLIMVTHDRYFLERVVNRITELSRGKLYHYEANYSKYLELKAQRAEMAEASERKRQSILRTEREWILRGCKARTTKSKDRIQRYEALRDQQAPEADESVSLAAASSRLGKKIIELRDVGKEYDDRWVLRHFSYGILRDDRIGIVGHNGVGKSTLLRLIAGELVPDEGSVEIGSTVRIGHFSQEGRELDSECGVASGVRRIEAYTGKVCLAKMEKNQEMLFEAAIKLKTKPAEVTARIQAQLDEVKELRRSIEQYKAKESAGEVDRFLFGSHNVGGCKVLTVTIPNADAGKLRQMGDLLRDKDPSVVAVLASVTGDKLTFLAVCGKEAVAKGIKAGELVKMVCSACGGSGGGKPDSAMGGGKDATKLDNALAMVDDCVVSKVQ